MENRVNRSAMELQAVFNTTSVGFGIIVNQVIREVNDAFCQMLGYSREEIIGKDARIFYPTDAEYQALEQIYQKITQTGSSITEIGLLRKDGEIIKVIMNISTFDKNDLAQGVILSLVNITERKQTEEALKESEEKYRLIVENTQDLVFIENTAGEVIYMSPSIKSVLGYNQADLVGRSFRSLIHPDDKSALEKAIKQNVKYGYQNTGGVEFRVRNILGEWRWYIGRGNAVRDANGNFINFIAIANDITARKQAEEALAASEQNFHSSLDSSPMGIRIVDTEWYTLYANQALLDMFGYKNIEELRASSPQEHYTPESYAGFLQYKEQSLRGESLPDQLELDIIRKDGAIRHMQLFSKTVLWNGKQQHQFLYNDITEREQAEKEKLQMEEKAHVNSRLIAVGEMAAGIAHEINNPLTSVLGFSQMLLEKENVPKDIKEDLKIIADASRRAADIIKRLLTFARQTKPLKTSVNLNELIDNTLMLREYVLKTSNINVITRFDPKLPWAVVDPGQMQQVFLNLIVNAEQAMKKAHGRGTLIVSTEKLGHNIRISFQDDGPGINKENIGHLFEPFFTTKAVGEGTGLGLSLSRSIVLEHNGKMNVESESGYGATFIIDLPIIESLPSGVDAQSSVKVKHVVTKKAKILVVDDEPGVRALLEKLLTQSGHSVDTIGDASEAMDKLGGGVPYDVILTDVRMPGMSGIELYARILEKAPEIKNRIIFITGDVMGTDIKTFLTENNLPYLAKPFDIKLLNESIESIIRANQLEIDNSDRSGE